MTRLKNWTAADRVPKSHLKLPLPEAKFLKKLEADPPLVDGGGSGSS